MPYINKQARDYVTKIGPTSSGELNYVITQLLITAWLRGGKNYAVINDILGALEGAKLEFYRRVAAPYEDKKIAENGDVY